jgi:4-amino-4-deoxy-L-arabinose transferase-like glycosyltransferase
VLAAAFFRLWLIDRIPPGLFGDEATDGLDALDVLAGRGAVFFPANFGREGLHMWIVAGMFRLLGVTPLALRLPSAIAGTLTAVATYWLGLELMKDERRGTNARHSFVFRLSSFVPLVAALYLATSYWHVHFSRFGIRGVFTPLFGALAFAAFWRAVNISTFQRSNVRTSMWFVLSGFLLGLATHFYTASRFFPFFLGGFLVLQAIVAYVTRRRDEAILMRHFLGIVLLFAVAALVFLPLGVYFIQHPGSFSQRASEVVATNAASPLALMGKAALANVLQFFVPGRGDQAQFYNLPGRAVFEPLTALLALIGLGVLLWRWRRPPALFLLLWLPALLLPSFLATDRFPTLPRVLGVIPAVYFYPAIGLVAVASLLGGWLSKGEREPRGRFSLHLRTAAPLLLCTLVLLVHAGFTYRDYFRAWGRSMAAFDAFEGDMTAAWQWLGANEPAGHVYLSSDIYRHPTFMLLGEKATVRTHFQHQNPDLSWFDARGALPLPSPGQPATYVIGYSTPLNDRAADLLAAHAGERDRVPAPDGSPALIVLEAQPSPAAASPLAALPAPDAFTDQLALTGAAWNPAPDGASELWLQWRTAGPEPAAWRGYRLEIAAGDQVAVVSFDAFRPPEWVPGGSFLTWHRAETAGDPPRELRLRLMRADDGQPVIRENAPEGWHAVALP